MVTRRNVTSISNIDINKTMSAIDKGGWSSTTERTLEMDVLTDSMFAYVTWGNISQCDLIMTYFHL